MVPVSKQTPKGVVIENKQRHIGYFLAQLLSKYTEVKDPRNTPESEPFTKFIFSILDTIVDRLKSEEHYSLPKSLFLDPASVLRVKIRRGPEISRKGKAAKSNLYIPFSFTKSSECTRMNESIRKELTSVGADVLKNINNINHLSVKDQSYYFEFFEKYISAAYTVSDEIRKQWRLEAKVVKPLAVKAALVDEFPSIEDLADGEVDTDKYLNQIKGRNLCFIPALPNSTEQAALKKQLQEEANLKKSQRQKR
jgi:hypothetical protein